MSASVIDSHVSYFFSNENKSFQSGEKFFVDMHVLLDSTQPVEDAHKLTEEIEITVKRIIPEADVTVHAEPIKKQ